MKTNEIEAVRLLHQAVWEGNAEAVSTLLAQGMEPDARDEAETPLIKAVRKGDLAIARLLLEAGACVTAADSDLGETVYTYAFLQRNPIPTLELLFEFGLPLEADGGFGDTPLMLAARDADAETLLYLLERGANIHARDRDQLTPLMHAIWGESEEVVQLLLERGARLDERDACGQSVAALALQVDWRDMAALRRERQPSIYWRHAEYHEDSEFFACMLRVLLEAGAEADVADDDGWTPLLLSLACGNTLCARLLLEHGASLAGCRPELVARACAFAEYNEFPEAVALLDELCTPSTL